MKLLKKCLYLLLIITFIPLLNVYAESGGYIVKFKDGYSPPNGICDFKLISKSTNLYYADSYDVVDKYKEQIEYAEPDKKVELIEGIGSISLKSMPVDDMYSRYWQLQMINPDGAWNLETYGNDIKVAVIDSGCYPHKDLGNNLLKGKNYFDGSTNVSDDIGHGTHVSGIIAAEMNDIGIVGIAPKAKILPLKCFGQQGDATIAMVIQAIEEAVNDYKCQVVNMSWGFNGYNSALEEVINDGYQKGVIFVASAGNDGLTSLYYPANYENVIGVGSVTQNKTKSSFSQYNKSVFVVASGQDVESTYNDGAYHSLRGTSQAAPFVSGLAALLLSADNNMNGNDFKNLLINTSEDLGTPGYDTKFGYGLINVESAINELISKKQCYVSPINTDKDKSYVLIKNVGNDILNATSVFAEYDGNICKSVKEKTITVMPEKNIIIANEKTNNRLSHFLWESINTIKPLADKREREKLR